MNKVAIAFGSASILAVAMGSIYIIDCRRYAKSGAEINSCWLTGLPIMGIGAAGGGGFKAGFNTFNPLLRRPEEER
jgi:hypothetical protein